MQTNARTLQEADEVLSFRRVGPTGSRASVIWSSAL